MIILFFKEKRMQQKHKYIRRYSWLYFRSFKRKILSQVFLPEVDKIKIRLILFDNKEKKRDVQIEKTNLISNVEEIITSAYSFYS